VIALDLPGHGASPPPASRSVAGYAGAVLGLLDALGLERAAFAGHSMGGAIALSLALDAPARVAALALVGTGARLRVAPAILQGTADPEAYARFADAAGGRAFGSGAGAALRRQHAEGLRALDPAVTHGDFLACDAFDVLARLPEIRAPTLVVCGTEDQLTPPKYARHLCDHIAGARLEMVPGAGHMVMLEAPGRVAGAIDGFLAGIG
jgi:pimeloyl-ACP methyl ester carboxylesterase